MGGLPVLMFMSAFIAANAAWCPEGFSFWYRENDQAKPSCYKFVRTQMSWMQARRNCQYLGGDLVSVETSGENAHLLSIINQDPSLKQPQMTGHRYWGYWMGGNDLVSEGVWRWAANNNQLTFTYWASGQPNNSFGDREHCLMMRKGLNWKWNDMICSEEFPGSICETEGK